MPFSLVSQQSHSTDYNTYRIPLQEFSPALGPGNTSLPSFTNYTGSLCNTVFNLKSFSLLSKHNIILHLPIFLTSWPPTNLPAPDAPLQPTSFPPPLHTSAPWVTGPLAWPVQNSGTPSRLHCVNALHCPVSNLFSKPTYYSPWLFPPTPNASYPDLDQCWPTHPPPFPFLFHVSFTAVLFII